MRDTRRTRKINLVVPNIYPPKKQEISCPYGVRHRIFRVGNGVNVSVSDTVSARVRDERIPPDDDGTLTGQCCAWPRQQGGGGGRGRWRSDG